MRVSTESTLAPHSLSAKPTTQGQRCAGCGVEATVWDRSQAPLCVTLTPVFGWHEAGRPALLCPTCKRGLRRNRGRARYSKARAGDGRLT
jgi:hypothetical protein